MEFKNIDNIFSKLNGTMYIPVRVSSKGGIVKQRALELKDYYDLIKQNNN